MSSNDFIDRLEQELQAASQRRVRLELARLPRLPAGVAVVALAAAIAVAVAVPFLAAHARSTATQPAGHGPGSAGVVVGCSDTISGQLSRGWRGSASGTVVTGPIAWLFVNGAGTHASIFRTHFVQALAVVQPGHDVTVTVPADERRDLSLDYTSVAPRSRFYLSQGASSVTFKPCPGSVGQTQFNGGFIVSGPQCPEVDVQPEGSGTPMVYFLPLGGTCHLPSGPPENVLKGNGIGEALFGEGPRSVAHKLHVLLGQGPTRRSFLPALNRRGTCGIDGELDWPGLEALFHHHRFVGYSYGPRTPDGSVSELATIRDLRVGETAGEGEHLYGPAFNVSPAQGGSFSVRTPQGVVDGYLSDVTNPHGKVLTIEAGHVGCPAMTP